MFTPGPFWSSPTSGLSPRGHPTFPLLHLKDVFTPRRTGTGLRVATDETELLVGPGSLEWLLPFLTRKKNCPLSFRVLLPGLIIKSTQYRQTGENEL